MIPNVGDNGFDYYYVPGVEKGPMYISRERAAELNATPWAAREAEQLKGAALDAALDEAGLPKTGSADEKRARLAEHAAATPEFTVPE